MRRLVVVVLAVALAGCGASQPRCTIDVPKPAHPQPFLWRAVKGDSVLWLYGTIHNGSAADVPAAAWRALAEAPRFASELGDAEPDPDRVAKLVRIESGKTLDYLLAPDDWYELRDVMRGTVKEDDLRRFRPWYAMVRLTQKLRPPPEETMDEALAARAKRAGKPVDALEAWHEQLEVLAAAVGVQDLRDAIHARKKVRCELDGMLAFYVAGDADAMQKWLDMPSSAQLLGARNAKWLAKLEGYAATGGAFVAVGLGHLIGDDNLPTLLAARGYAVARVP